MFHGDLVSNRPNISKNTPNRAKNSILRDFAHFCRIYRFIKKNAKIGCGGAAGVEWTVEWNGRPPRRTRFLRFLHFWFCFFKAHILKLRTYIAFWCQYETRRPTCRFRMSRRQPAFLSIPFLHLMRALSLKIMIIIKGWGIKKHQTSPKLP